MQTHSARMLAIFACSFFAEPAAAQEGRDMRFEDAGFVMRPANTPQALVRIGNDKKTNLLIGGEVLGGIGLRGITQLELDTFERVPIVLRTVVTNQPAGSPVLPVDVRPPEHLPPGTSVERGEVGARAIVQVGYELAAGFVVAARGSYQGRTINHAGPGFGGAVMYTW